MTRSSLHKGSTSTKRPASGRTSAHAHATDLLLLDEPYNSLDADGVELVNDLIRTTQRADGATLVVSHEPERMRDLADRVAAMNAGLLDDGDGEAATTDGDGARAAHVTPESAAAKRAQRAAR